MQKIKQSSATRHIMFLMVDSTDHVTGKTGLTPTVTISKNAGTFASPAGAITEVSGGWYKLAANATDSNTLGLLALHATGTAADPTDFIAADIVAYDPDDAVRLGMTGIANAAAGASGGLLISGSNSGTTTLAALTVTGATTLTGAVSATGSNDIRIGATERGLIRDKIVERTAIPFTVGTGSTTAAVVVSATTPATTDADQLKGRVIVFNNDTTTAALRGQAAAIVSHTSGATPTLTCATASFTTAPLSGDTGTIV